MYPMHLEDYLQCLLSFSFMLSFFCFYNFVILYESILWSLNGAFIHNDCLISLDSVAYCSFATTFEI